MSAPANPLAPSQGVPCHVGFATLIASAFTSFMVPTLMAAGTALFAPGPRMVRPEFHGLGNGVFLRGAQLPGGDFSFRLEGVAVLFPLIKKAQLEQGGVCMVGYDARFIGRRLRFPEQENAAASVRQWKNGSGAYISPFYEASCLYVDHIPLAFNGGSSLCRNMFGVRFFMSCAVVGTYVWKRGKKGGKGGLNPPLRPAPSKWRR